MLRLKLDGVCASKQAPLDTVDCNVFPRLHGSGGLPGCIYTGVPSFAKCSAPRWTLNMYYTVKLSVVPSWSCDVCSDMYGNALWR